jgi:hypothetical protein
VLGACWPLTKFWEYLGHNDLFWSFNSLSKEEHKMKRRSWDHDPLLGPFLGFSEYVTGMGCQPMGLPMFRPILYVYIDV